MTKTHTCTGFGRRYVDIDIGKVQDNGRYKDHCRNSISVQKQENVPGKGYKRYTHTPLTKPYYIGGIYYNGKQQDSIRVTDSGLYNKSVTVYYLDYDATNALPLIVGLEKTWFADQYYYHKREYPLSSSSKWKDEERDVSHENQLLSKLTAITSQLNDLVVLNLTKTKDTYYANGEDEAPTTNPTLQIQVTGPNYIHTIYKRYKHAPTVGSTIRLLSTKTTSTNIPFNPPVYGTWCSEVCVYSWSLDSGHSNPLLLEIKSISYSTYYTLTKDGRAGKKWTKSGISDISLLDTLDKENCKNGAHIMDISQKGSYQCPSCGSKQVTVVPANILGYSSYFHYIYGGFFSRLKNKGVEQAGLTLSGRISSVFVYRYPKGPNGIPLLIYLPLSSNKWFERTSIDSNNWRSVSSSKPASTFDRGGILKLLQAKLPTVTINIGHTTGLDTSESSTTYSDSSEQINLEKKDLNDSFSSLSHTVQGKSTFILGGIKHNGSPLEGVPQNLVVKNVKAYYYAKGGFTPDNLLTVGFEKISGSRKNYVYYSKETKTSIWKPDLQKNTKSGAPPLTTQLREIKEKLSAGKSQKSNGNESNAGVIAGGVFGSLTSGTAVGLGIWKGPAIVRSIITTFMTSV